MSAEESPESLDIDNIIESESQNNSQQLQIELCVLKSKMQTIELENKTLKEETESQREKIKNFTDYFESIQDDEDTAERLQEELKEKENELQRLTELIAEEIMNSEKAQKEYEIEISKSKQEVVGLETEIEQTKIELAKTKEVSQLSYDTYFNDLTVLKEEKEAQEVFFNKENEKMQGEMRQLKEKNDQLQTKQDELIEANTLSMTELIDKYTNDMKSLQQTQQNASKNFNEVKDLKAKVFKMEHEKELLKAEISSKQSLLNDQLQLNKELNENINKLNEENSTLEAKIDEMKSNMLNDIGSKSDHNSLFDGNALHNGNIADVHKQLEEMRTELLKYKALDDVITINTNHSLMYKSEIKKMQCEVKEYKNKCNDLLTEVKKEKENVTALQHQLQNQIQLQQQQQQPQQLSKLGTIAEKRLTFKPLDFSKNKMEKVSNNCIAMNQRNNNNQNSQGNMYSTPKKQSIDETIGQVQRHRQSIESKDQSGVIMNKKNSFLNNTMDGNNNNNSQSTATNQSELQKQVLFLTEQNKSYQKDIAMSNKNTKEIVDKINQLQEKNSTLETQLITKDREINKYKILVNRLKLKERE